MPSIRVGKNEHVRRLHMRVTWRGRRFSLSVLFFFFFYFSFQRRTEFSWLGNPRILLLSGLYIYIYIHIMHYSSCASDNIVTYRSRCLCCLMRDNNNNDSRASLDGSHASKERYIRIHHVNPRRSPRGRMVAESRARTRNIRLPDLARTSAAIAEIFMGFSQKSFVHSEEFSRE